MSSCRVRRAAAGAVPAHRLRAHACCVGYGALPRLRVAEPYSTGDLIQVSGTTGYVERITFRATQVTCHAPRSSCRQASTCVVDPL